jgi:hypothetical protein
MSLFLKDGLEWLQNKTKKIEGYRGIMGPIKDIDQINDTDPDIVNSEKLSTDLTNQITDYNTKFTNLQDSTNNYLGTNKEGSFKKNYNMYVNKSMDMGKITSTAYSGGACIANGVSNAALQGLTDASTKGFDIAYPNNFPNTPAGSAAAINACKIWAADSQSSLPGSRKADSYFAVTKDNTNNKYKCYYGSQLTGTPSQYSSKKLAYSVASSTDATRGGLFSDGTVGVYNHLMTGTDVSNPYSAYTTSKLTGYSTCDRLFGGSLNTSTISATLGANCTNVTNPPVKIRYVIINSSGNYIQIAQLVVMAFKDGIGQNVSNKQTNNKAVAHSGNGANQTNQTDSGFNGVNPNTAIDGTISARGWPNLYASASPDRTEWWKLDLGQEYPVYQIDYYNRTDCCNNRAIGMTMQFQDNDGKLVTVKDVNNRGVSTTALKFTNGSAKQSFTISS